MTALTFRNRNLE